MELSACGQLKRLFVFLNFVSLMALLVVFHLQTGSIRELSKIRPVKSILGFIFTVSRSTSDNPSLTREGIPVSSALSLTICCWERLEIA